MDNLGDIKTAAELGYKGHALYQYSTCASCGQKRWVRTHDLGQGRGLVCRGCGYPVSNLLKRKLQKLIDAGAKQASELGKPVPKKRNPWYYPHQCSICGNLVWHQKRDLHRVCSSCAYVVRETPSGSRHPNWRGGRYHHGDGYIVVQVPQDSPYRSMAHGTGYILGHRLIMAQHLGRCLLDSEVVHHINGDKADNRIENLELLPSNTSHLPYIRLQQQVIELEKRVHDQGIKIKLLEWRIRELEHGNPELAEDVRLRASVETLQEAPSIPEGEEKVHSYEKS